MATSEEECFPRWTYVGIQEIARGFLASHHPSNAIPVPIDRIIERFGIEIVPLEGLRQACGADAFTTADLAEIKIDRRIFDEFENRYRFSLAHELGHILLHERYYRSQSWSTITEWKAAHANVPAVQFSWMETNADTFAGLVLVPDTRVSAEIEKCRGTILNYLPAAENEAPEQYADLLAACIANTFSVSKSSANVRLNHWFRRR